MNTYFGNQVTQGIGSHETTKVFTLCHQFTTAPGGSNRLDDTVFRLSDPTDVEGAAGADQPTGWEEVSAFYEHAKVLSCWVTCEFTNVSTAHASLVMGLIADTDGTSLDSTSTVWTTWCGFPRSQTKRLQSVDLDAGVGSKSETIYMKYGCKPHKVFNQTVKNQRFEMTVPDTAAADTVFLHIIQASHAEGVNAATSLVECTLKFHWKVNFYDRLNLAKGADA